MAEYVLAGEQYRDDRMFLLYVGKCTVSERGDQIETVLHHGDVPLEHSWCLVSYRNTEALPAYRIDHFYTEAEAVRYMQEVAPSMPRVSLGGRPPYPPLTFQEHERWEREHGFAPYDPLSMFLPGGTNRRELFTTPKK